MIRQARRLIWIRRLRKLRTERNLRALIHGARRVVRDRVTRDKVLQDARYAKRDERQPYTTYPPYVPYIPYTTSPISLPSLPYLPYLPQGTAKKRIGRRVLRLSWSDSG